MSTKDDPPLGRWGHFAWIDPYFDEDSMLVFGGRYGEDYINQSAFSDIWRFNLKTCRWSKLSDGISGRTIMVNNNGAVATGKGKMFFTNSNRPMVNVSLPTEIWLYEVQRNQFTLIPVSHSSFVPKQEWLFSVILLNSMMNKENDNFESLVVYGGWQQNEFYRFDLATGVFHNLSTAGSNIPPRSAGHLGISVRDANHYPLYMIWSANNQPIFWFYSFTDDTWTSKIISSPPPRLYTQAVPISNNGSISLLTSTVWFVVGGHDINSNRCLSDVWALGNF